MIEIDEVMYSILTNHSKTTWSYMQRYTNSCICQTPSDKSHILPLNDPQLKWTTQLTIEVHIPSLEMHIASLLHSADNTLLHQPITYHITPRTHLFPFLQHHTCSPTERHALTDHLSSQTLQLPIWYQTISLSSTHSDTMPVVSSHPYPFNHLVITCINN